jgi:hypothetical protein
VRTFDFAIVVAAVVFGLALGAVMAPSKVTRDDALVPVDTADAQSKSRAIHAEADRAAEAAATDLKAAQARALSAVADSRAKAVAAEAKLHAASVATFVRLEMEAKERTAIAVAREQEAEARSKPNAQVLGGENSVFRKPVDGTPHGDFGAPSNNRPRDSANMAINQANAARERESAAFATASETQAEAKESAKASEEATKKLHNAQIRAASAASAASLKAIEEVLEELPKGNIAFNTPTKARVGKQFEVQAALSLTLPPNEVKALVEQEGKIEVATIKAWTHMYASLSGGSAFDVAPAGDQQQLITAKEPSQWIWQVTPKTSDSQSLILRVGVILDRGEIKGPKPVGTYERKIEVGVGWPETPAEWLEFIKETIEGFSAVWGVIGAAIVAAAAYLARRFFGREKPPVDPATRLSSE